MCINHHFIAYGFQQDKGRPLPKFGEWDVNDPASAEGFTVIFNKARNERKTGAAKDDSPPKDNNNNNNTKYKHHVVLGKPHHSVRSILYFFVYLHTIW